MKFGLSSITFVLSLVRSSSIIFTEFSVVADSVQYGPWDWEVEPLIPWTFNEASREKRSNAGRG